jgi:hypothetical protein
MKKNQIKELEQTIDLANFILPAHLEYVLEEGIVKLRYYHGRVKDEYPRSGQMMTKTFSYERPYKGETAIPPLNDGWNIKYLISIPDWLKLEGVIPEDIFERKKRELKELTTRLNKESHQDDSFHVWTDRGWDFIIVLHRKGFPDTLVPRDENESYTYENIMDFYHSIITFESGKSQP